MAVEKQENKFEFSLKINNHPVITRYFSADGYNPKIRNSVNITHLVDDIIEMIQHDLKMKDIDFIYAKESKDPKNHVDLRNNSFMQKWSTEIKKAKNDK